MSLFFRHFLLPSFLPASLLLSLSLSLFLRQRNKNPRGPEGGLCSLQIQCGAGAVVYSRRFAPKVLAGLAGHISGLRSPAHLLVQDPGCGGPGSDTRLTRPLFPFCSDVCARAVSARRASALQQLPSRWPSLINCIVGRDGCHRYSFVLFCFF